MSVVSLEAEGFERLASEDPLAGLEVFRELRRRDSGNQASLIGLGRSHLLLARPWIALRYADAALLHDAHNDEAWGLKIRAMLRGRAFRKALHLAEAEVDSGHRGVELLAAYASALFRMQKNDEAGEVYHEVLRLDSRYAEAHLRLGSGLTAPRRVAISNNLTAGIRASRSGDFSLALKFLERELKSHPGNPIAHRLIGEAIYNQQAVSSMSGTAEEYSHLRATIAIQKTPELDPQLLADFMPQYPGLSPERQAVVRHAVSLFSSSLPRLIAIQGRHDLLMEDERTTDAVSRRSLQGRRTFDGRVWDDVRGIGGLRAATGIEALDEACQCGFDTLSHEIAHQAHLYGLLLKFKGRIRRLYREALAKGHCLDFYAATNDAEYFAQGVEAFACLAKRPAHEATHGHTRFELKRVDPALYDFIESHVDFDLLSRDHNVRTRRDILRAAIKVALRCGRPADAVTAAEMLAASPAQAELLRTAKHALALSRSL